MADCVTSRRGANGLREFCQLPAGHWLDPNMPEGCIFDLSVVRRYWVDRIGLGND